MRAEDGILGAGASDFGPLLQDEWVLPPVLVHNLLAVENCLYPMEAGCDRGLIAFGVSVSVGDTARADGDPACVTYICLNG